MSAGFETFWEVLQYYPKDYIVYQPYLQSEAFVQLQGTVTKSSAGGPYLQLQIQVDPPHNPLLHPPEPLGILSLTEMTNPELELAPQAQDDSGSQSDDLSTDDITEDDEEAMFDELHLDDSAELSMIQELNEHGRTVLPEDTSAPLPPDPASSSQPGLGNAGNPEQQSGQQILEVRQYFGGKFGRYGASKVAMAHPAGGRVQVHCKVSPGAAPGETFWQALFLSFTSAPVLWVNVCTWGILVVSHYFATFCLGECVHLVRLFGRHFSCHYFCTFSLGVCAPSSSAVGLLLSIASNAPSLKAVER